MERITQTENQVFTFVRQFDADGPVTMLYASYATYEAAEADRPRGIGMKAISMYGPTFEQAYAFAAAQFNADRS